MIPEAGGQRMAMKEAETIEAYTAGPISSNPAVARVFFEGV